MKGQGHNCLMLNLGYFFIFCSDFPKFWYVSYKLIAKHFSGCFVLDFSSFSRNNMCKKRWGNKMLLLFLYQQKKCKESC